MLNIVFMGTPDFAVPGLQHLLAAHKLTAVYTQPDRPAGRGRKLKPSAVKQAALDAGLDVRQPVRLHDETDALEALDPDLIVVIAYGLILPEAILGIPHYGCVNVHGSLLPRWRGAAPIQRAIENGDPTTGISIMQMDAGLDTGPILLQREIEVGRHSSATLYPKLAELGAHALLDAIEQIETGTSSPATQDESQASYARKIEKQDAVIDWSQDAHSIDRKIRAFNPWPACTTQFQDMKLKLWDAQPKAENPQAEPGTVIRVDRQGIDIACGTGTLTIRQLQKPGGKIVEAAQFLNGTPITAGDRLQ